MQQSFDCYQCSQQWAMIWVLSKKLRHNNQQKSKTQQWTQITPLPMVDVAIGNWWEQKKTIYQSKNAAAVGNGWWVRFGPKC